MKLFNNKIKIGVVDPENMPLSKRMAGSFGDIGLGIVIGLGLLAGKTVPLVIALPTFVFLLYATFVFEWKSSNTCKKDNNET